MSEKSETFSFDDFYVEFDFEKANPQTPDVSDILGTNIGLDQNQAVLDSAQQEILEEDRETIESSGLDYNEIVDNLPTPIDEDEISPGRQVFPVTEPEDRDHFDAYDEYDAAIRANVTAYKELLDQQGMTGAEKKKELAAFTARMYAGIAPTEMDGLFGTPNTVLISRNPTAMTAKIAYEAEKLRMAEEDNIFESFYGALIAGPTPDQYMEVQSMVDNGVYEFDTEFLKRVDELTSQGKSKTDAREQAYQEYTEREDKPPYKFALSDAEKQEREKYMLLGTDTFQEVITTGAALAMGAGAAATTFKTVPGPLPVKATIAGTAFLGTTMMGKMGTETLFNLRFGAEDLPYDVPMFKTGKTAKGVFDVATSMSDAVTGVPTMRATLKMLPEASRAYFTTAIVDAAVKLGLADTIAESPKFQSFVQSVAENPALSQRALEERYLQSTNPALHGAVKMLQVVFHPTVQKELKTAAEKFGLDKNSRLGEYFESAAKFNLNILGVNEDLISPEESLDRRASMLQEILQEIAGTEDFRRAKQLERLQSYNRMKKEVDEETKLQALDYDDDLFYKEFRNFRDNPEKYSDLDEKLFVKNFIDGRVWNTANTAWRGKQPSVKNFRTFINTHYAMGGEDPDPETYPEQWGLFRSVIDGESDEQIQERLNRVPFGVLASFEFSNRNRIWERPSFDEMKSFALKVLKYKEEERGQQASQIAQKGLSRRLFKPVEEKGYSLMMKPTLNYQIMSKLNMADAMIDELPIVTPDFAVPYLERLGFPKGRWGTGAGLDYALGTGLRDGMDDYWARVRSKGRMLTGGGMMGPEEVLLAAGFQRDDREMMFTLFNAGVDFAPKEAIAIKGVATPIQAGFAALNASRNRMFKSIGGQAQKNAARIEIMNGIQRIKSGDLTVQYHKNLVNAFYEEIAAGRNPLRFLTRAEQDLLEDAFILAGRNPDHGKAAMQKATKAARNVKGMSRQSVMDVGDNEYAALRSSKPYIRLEKDIDNLVNANVIDLKYASELLSMIEHQSIVAARAPSSRFKSPVDVIRNTRVTYNKIPGAGINPTVRVVDADNLPVGNRSGVPKGYFEFDERTGKSIINFFRDGDIDSVWKLNGVFMSHLLGDRFAQRTFRSFDHTFDSNGRVKLTARGKQQFGEAWNYYRRTQDNTNGFIRRSFDELWLSIHNFWSKLRRKPYLLDPEVRMFWDLEFGVAPTEKRVVRSAQTAAAFRRSRQHFETDTPGGDISALQRSRESMAKNVGITEEVVRSLLGDRKTTTIRNVFDETIGRTRRVVEQKYLPRDYDAVEATVQILALIKSADFRKRAQKNNYSTIGTRRYHVSDQVLPGLVQRVNDRLNAAMGEKFVSTRKKLFQVGRDGKNDLKDPATYPTGVTQRDVANFIDRMQAMKPDADGLTTALAQDFYVLEPRTQAGFKTLLQEIGNQPEADFLPIQMLDPNANFRILSNLEYRKVNQVLQDIEATPLNRRSRNTVDPGFRETVEATLSSTPALRAFVTAWNAVTGFAGKRAAIKKTAYDPGLAEIFEGGGRKSINVGKDLIELSKTKDFSNIDILGEFFKRVIDISVPRVNLSLLNDLYQIVGELGGLFDTLEYRAGVTKTNRKAQSGSQSPILYDVSTESVQVNYIISKTGVIQELLDGVYGMTPAEREALNIVRTVGVRQRSGVKLSDLAADEIAELADAISVLHLGLKVKEDYILTTGENLLKRSLVMQEVPVTGYGREGRRKILYNNYRAYFEGDTDYLFMQPEMNIRYERTKGVDTKANIRFNKRLEKLGININSTEANVIRSIHKAVKKQAGSNLADDNLRMISMLTLMKLDEVQMEIADELVRYGYTASKRKIFGNIDITGRISLNRERYLDRVMFYLHSVMDTSDWVRITVDEQGKRVKGAPIKYPAKPEETLYGNTETLNRKFDNSKQFRDIDVQAKQDAHEIIARAGMRVEQGKMEIVNIGDKQFLLPRSMFDFFKDYQLQMFPNARFKKVWGKGGSGEFFLKGVDPEGAVVRQLETAIAALARLAGILFSPTAFYSGLLIGTGGLPMIGYGVGVFIGGLSQLHLGKGMAAVVRDGLQGPVVLAETLGAQTARSGARLLPENMRAPLLSLADSLQANTGFTAGVLARLHGKDFAVPETKPLILPDGRVFTADEIANSVGRYGWRSAMVDAFQDPRIVDQFYERFTKANPVYVTTAVSTLLGLTIPGAGVGLSAAFGFGLGYILKPGNLFSKAHRFYRESFSAIDSFLRVKLLVDELKAGKSLEQASITVRDVALDYSNLSDAEKSYFARYFAFYAYYSQAMKLFVEATIKNPQRVINQLKFIQKTQQEYADDPQASEFLAPWDRYRAFLPFKIGGETYRPPFLISGDSAGLLYKALGMIPLLNSGEDVKKNFRSLIGMTNPLVPLFLKYSYDIDEIRGAPLSRSSFVVPYDFIMWDLRSLGGTFYELLDIEHIAPEDLRFKDEDKEKTRISLGRIEHPGRGVYIANNRAMYLYLFDYLQSPLTGRMGANLQALSRANVNGQNYFLDLLEQATDDGKPILGTVGPLLALNLIREKDPGYYDFESQQFVVDPTDPLVAPLGEKGTLLRNKQITTASLDLLLSQGRAFEKDGKVFVYTNQFYPEELGRIFGFTRAPQFDSNKQMGRMIRSRLPFLKENLKSIEADLEKIKRQGRLPKKPDSD